MALKSARERLYVTSRAHCGARCGCGAWLVFRKSAVRPGILDPDIFIPRYFSETTDATEDSADYWRHIVDAR